MYVLERHGAMLGGAFHLMTVPSHFSLKYAKQIIALRVLKHMCSSIWYSFYAICFVAW